MTLNKRGFFAGRSRDVLPAEAIHAVGQDAVMVLDESSIVASEDAPDDVGHPAMERDVLGDDVLTEGGSSLGKVADLVLLVGSSGEVVGYQIDKAGGGAGLHPAAGTAFRLRGCAGGPEYHRGVRPRRSRRPRCFGRRVPGPVRVVVSESFKRSAGRKVLSRSSAKEVGAVSHLLVDAQQRRIAAVVIGRGKKAQLVDWAQLSGFGPDAVMVVDEGALRPPADDRERAAAEGKLDLVGKRALSERGNELGELDDVTFDADTGALEELLIGDRRVHGRILAGQWLLCCRARPEPGALTVRLFPVPRGKARDLHSPPSRSPILTRV